MQDSASLLDINETFPTAQEPNSFYGKAKKIAEERLLKLSTQMEIIVLRPSFIWGSGCPSIITISDIVKAGQFVWINQGEVAFEAVHVENVAEAVNLALSNGKDRGIYFVTDGESTTVKFFFSQLFLSLGLPIPTRSISSVVAHPLASLMETVWKFFKVKGSPPITRFDLAFVAMPRRYSTKLIEVEMGYVPVMNRAEGFRQLILDQT